MWREDEGGKGGKRGNREDGKREQEARSGSEVRGESVGIQ